MATATVKEELDVLESPIQNKEWSFSDEETTRTYIQKPLSFFRKLEFFSLLGDAIDSLSDNGKSLNLAAMFGGDANIDNLVAVLSRVASEVPETLQNCYCVFLDVPKHEREWAKWRMEEELSDDDGFAILDLFIEQNADALQDFFGEKGQGLVKKVTKKFGLNAPVPSSKPSKRTAASTPKV